MMHLIHPLRKDEKGRHRAFLPTCFQLPLNLFDAFLQVIEFPMLQEVVEQIVGRQPLNPVVADIQNSYSGP